MKRKKTIAKILVPVALVVLLLAGCGAKPDANAPAALYNREYAETADTMKAAGGYDDLSQSSFVLYNNAANGGEEEANAADRFVIVNAQVRLQTKDYAKFSKALQEKLKALGGYTDAYEEYAQRADITARVPSDVLEEFIANLAQTATVVSKSITRSDVTDEMIDTGSKKAALEAEEKALLAVLEKAETVKDIIQVQDRLSQVRGDLQSYIQRLQSLQNQVSYSTVTITVNEVERISTPSQKFTSLAGSGFVASLRNIGSGARNLAIWVVSALPYLVLLAIPVVLIVLLIKKARNKKRSK